MEPTRLIQARQGEIPPSYSGLVMMIIFWSVYDDNHDDHDGNDDDNILVWVFLMTIMMIIFWSGHDDHILVCLWWKWWSSYLDQFMMTMMMIIFWSDHGDIDFSPPCSTEMNENLLKPYGDDAVPGTRPLIYICLSFGCLSCICLISIAYTSPTSQSD